MSPSRYAEGIVFLEDELKGNYPEGNIFQRAAACLTSRQKRRELAKSQKEEYERQMRQQTQENLKRDWTIKVEKIERKNAEVIERQRHERETYIEEHKLGYEPSFKSKNGWIIRRPTFPEGTLWEYVSNQSNEDGTDYRALGGFADVGQSITYVDADISLAFDEHYSTKDDSLIVAIVHSKTFNKDGYNKKTYVLETQHTRDDMPNVIELIGGTEPTYLRIDLIHFDSDTKFTVRAVRPVLPKAQEPEYYI